MATELPTTRVRPPSMPPTAESTGAAAGLCTACSSPYAADQAYCLSCGRRVGERRDDLLAALAPAPVAVREVALPTTSRGPFLWSPLGGGALAGVLAMGLAFGAIALGGDEPRAQDIVVNVPRQPAARVVNNISGGGAAVPVAEFVSDWPGDDGWTVQLDALPKDGTQPAQVDAAKADATGKGAEDVGALDSDDHASLDAGEYLVYSGVFDTKAAATKALKGLKKDFPGAKVVKVAADGGAAPKLSKDTKKASDDELEQLESTGGDDFVKKSKKLPDKVGTSGAAPKKDNKTPGAGSEGTTIG